MNKLATTITLLTAAMVAGQTFARAEEAPAPAAAAAPAQAIMCPKCQAVWVKDTATVNSHQTTVYVTSKKMMCPECKTAAENFFAGKNAEHTCKICGEMKVCDAHQAGAAAAAAKTADANRAVMCSKCEALWVKQQVNLPRATIFVPVKQEVCSDCKKAADAYLAGGEIMSGKCAKCGGEMNTCSAAGM